MDSGVGVMDFPQTDRDVAMGHDTDMGNGDEVGFSVDGGAHQHGGRRVKGVDRAEFLSHGSSPVNIEASWFSG